MSQAMEIDYHDTLIREREQGIKDIERTVQEVNEIFIDLSNLVSEQGSMIGEYYYVTTPSLTNLTRQHRTAH